MSENLTEKLVEANKKAENQKAERRARTVKGSHLTKTFIDLAVAAGVDVRENTGFYVLQGVAGKALRIYVAKRGGIVDLLGFTVAGPAVRQVSKDEAKAKHMGRVQGRLNLELSDDSIIAAYREAVKLITTPVAVVEKPKARKLTKQEIAGVVAVQASAANTIAVTKTA
jgi:hypothetical protein